MPNAKTKLKANISPPFSKFILRTAARPPFKVSENGGTLERSPISTGVVEYLVLGSSCNGASITMTPSKTAVAM